MRDQHCTASEIYDADFWQSKPAKGARVIDLTRASFVVVYDDPATGQHLEVIPAGKPMHIPKVFHRRAQGYRYLVRFSFRPGKEVKR